jgi:superfamily II DNA or RNA helicase
MSAYHYKTPLKIDLKAEHERNVGRFRKGPLDHQIAAHKKMSAFYSTPGKRGLLVLPTGAGKTFTAVFWLLKHVVAKQRKVLWLADQGFLLEQAYESFREAILEISPQQRTQVQMNLVSGSARHASTNTISPNDDILLMTAQTAIGSWDSVDSDDDGKPIVGRFREFLKSAEADHPLFVVYDEAHHTPAFGRRNLLIGGSEGKTGILQQYPAADLLGLTATPTYTDASQRGWLWEIFSGRVIHEEKRADLEDAGILAHPKYLPERTDFKFDLTEADLERIVLKHQELPSRIVESIAKNEARNEYIAQFYNKNVQTFGKTIIFVDRWYQCKTIEKKLNENAGKEVAASVFSQVDGSHNVEFINSRTQDQNDINLERFRKGEISVLLNVRMLTEGVDVPDVKTIFITRETNSHILATQMIGRALRGRKAGGGKDEATIVFFTDNWNKHLQFASSQILGGTEERKVEDRGYRPLELVSIALIEQLNLEMEKDHFEISVVDLVAAGWYSVTYADMLVEEIDGTVEKSVESFSENVLVYEDEKLGFEHFVSDFLSNDRTHVWEQEDLPRVEAERIAAGWITKHFPGGVRQATTLPMRLIQVARHLGQNRTQPQYFALEQKRELDMAVHVAYVVENDLGHTKMMEYLEGQYRDPHKTLLAVVFHTFDKFFGAFLYELRLQQSMKRGPVEISEPDQSRRSLRLASADVRAAVLSRDDKTCQCCGRTDHLEIDHLLASKHQEPDDDRPDVYQTLCRICNGEKAANSYNYRITNYSPAKMKLRDVRPASDKEDAVYYLTRLVNCYYATSAVQKNSVKATNNGNAIWRLNLKHGANASQNILKEKTRLLEVIRARGYSLKDLIITET